ncbi:alpha/beta hydrolase [Cronbergia sp. UHCC 0137]|uniref:alpha/beta hydrolase n=1 Tax=Cronbergia sp. UHCC 0137 TaxID=3110239 RepID=UPI002B207B90|nr:alpha/beta hydrolase [Cronbergia sp. UHCC 0137]MEA5618575.1 alpha/beta hydrolase [Cronbergia sp. UHCC 0137]
MFTGKSWKNFTGIKGVFSKLGKAFTVGIALIPIFAGNSSVQAADTVVVRYGLLEETIPLTELQNIAKTGEFPASLRSYTKRLSEKQRRFLLQVFSIRIPINVVTLSRLLNTQIGNTILNDISTALVRKDDAGVQALRGGLILAAAKPEGLSVVSFIDSYPSKRLEINIPQALKVARNLNTDFWRTQQFLFALGPRLNSRKVKSFYSVDPNKLGNATVKVTTLILNDQKRDTYGGQSQRNIPLDIYSSNSATPNKPLIVFSHGLGSVRTDLRYLAEHLASHGYIVAALEHPGSNAAYAKLSAKSKYPLLNPQEFLERPRDVSFVLDELERLNKTANNPLQGKLATNNVMVVGYSFGGATALALGGGELQLEKLKERCKSNLTGLSLGRTVQCVAQGLPENSYQLRDSRVKQVVVFNPTTSLLFGETGLSKVQVPTLVLANSADRITPALPEQMIGFTKIPVPKWLVVAIGATHLSVQDPNIIVKPEQKLNTPFSGAEVVGEKAADVRKFVQGITLAMAARLTPEPNQYADILTSNYAQNASTQMFPFRLVTEIPSEAMGLIKKFEEK